MTQASDISQTGGNRRSQMTRERIVQLIDEMDELSRSDCDPVLFRQQLLNRAVRGTDAVAGCVWRLPAPSLSGQFVQPEPECHMGLDDIAWPAGQILTAAEWLPLLTEAAEAAEAAAPLTVAAHSETHSNGFRNSLNNVLTAATFPCDNDVRGGVVLFHDVDASPECRLGTQQVLRVLCDLATDFQRNHQMRSLSLVQSEQQVFERVRRDVLKCDDPQTLTHAIANEGQRYLQCDRLSVVVRRRRQFVVQCVSGTDSVDCRSTTVRMLQSYAAIVAAEGNSRWITSGEDHTADVLTETGAVRLGAYPLSSVTGSTDSLASPNSATAVHSVMIVEMFTPLAEAELDALKRRADRMANEFGPLLAFMNRIDTLPLIGVSRFLNRSRILRGVLRWRMKWVAVVLLVAAAVAAAMTQVDFDVEARGVLQPVEQEFIYAPRDGIVVDFPAVGDDTATSKVHPGDIVIQLRNSELDLELTRILGQQQAVSQRLNTVSVLLEQMARRQAAERNQFSQLTAEKLELEIELASVSEQLKMLREEKQQLTLATHIHGQIQTWNFVKQLKSRPVRQGSHLMTIANIGGAWRLELNIPDPSINDVNTARQQSGGVVPIRFLIRSAPEKHHTANLQDVANVTQWIDNHGLCVRATANLERTELPKNLRPGTAVIAKIHCGRRSLAAVWLNDLIRSVRQKLMF